jgi:hypothetical protein
MLNWQERASALNERRPGMDRHPFKPMQMLAQL